MGQPLVDTFGRIHRDLRLSVTDRCNFRCSYCLPDEGIDWLPRHDVLSYEEIERVARLLVEEHGVDSIRITGGEPTVRAHLPALVEKLAALRPPGGGPVDLAMTTNGASLDVLAAPLAAAGLGRVNISLDSLRGDRFQAITRRDALDQVLAGIDAATAAGLHPVKINVVVVRGVNDDELVDFAEFGRDRGVQVRFIEFMPLDGHGTWTDDQVVGGDEIISRIHAVHPLLAPEAHGSDPAAPHRFADGRGSVGVISSVTDDFCGTCDRIRLTADGRFRNCLFALDELDLRGPLRAGAGDDELSALVQGSVAAKWAGHRINQPVFVRPRRSMSQIGG